MVLFYSPSVAFCLASYSFSCKDHKERDCRGGYDGNRKISGLLKTNVLVSLKRRNSLSHPHGERKSCLNPYQTSQGWAQVSSSAVRHHVKTGDHALGLLCFFICLFFKFFVAMFFTCPVFLGKLSFNLPARCPAPSSASSRRIPSKPRRWQCLAKQLYYTKRPNNNALENKYILKKYAI